MGTYYHYVNLTKRERFSIATLGGGMKHGAIGRTPATRVFELLLTRRKQPDRPPESGSLSVGHWAGDQIAILGDDSEPAWEKIKEEFADIAANAIMLFKAIEGFEALGEAAASSDELFMEVCHLIVTRQAAGLMEPMQARFGSDFLSHYGKLCTERKWFVPKDLVDLKHNG